MGAKIAQVRPLSHAAGYPEHIERPEGTERPEGPERPAGSLLLRRENVLTGTDVLPVLPALRGLLTAGGLQRGQVVTTDGWGLLCLALAAGASAGGAWCAAVGLPLLGVRAAVDAGLDPDRLLLVAEPGASWPQVVASLLDGCDMVLLRPSDRPSAQLRRKLEATARRHGSVLLVAGEWEGAPTRLRVAAQEWAGLGVGHGRLRARKARVAAEGRGAGARSRDTWLWLPGPDGAVAAVTDATPLAVRESVASAALDSAALDSAALDSAARAVAALASAG